MYTLILYFMSILSVQTMKVSSPAFNDGAYIPLKYSCEGQSINPPIVIENISKEAKSLALIVDDPDAMKGTFTHWIIWNMEPGKMIAENTAPGVEGKNGSGKIG